MARIDLALLLSATLKIYWQSLVRAWKGIRRAVLWAFLPLAYLPIFYVVGMLAGLFPPILAGFIMGMLWTFALAHYLAAVRSAVRDEKTSRRILWNEAQVIFFPAISVGFVLFGVSLLLGMLQRTESSAVLGLLVNLAIVILFNPMLELLYWTSGSAGNNNPFELFAEALGFMKENVVEWIAPQALLLLPFILVDPEGIFRSFASMRLLDLPLMLMAVFSGTLGNLPSEILAALIIFPAVFFFMIFRGLLFRELSTSTRRKRIFSAKL